MGSEKRKIKFKKDILKTLMKENRMKQKDLAGLLDLRLDTVKGAFRDGEMLPEHLERLARFFDVDFNYLTCETLNISSVSGGGVLPDEDARELFRRIHKLDEYGFVKGYYEDYYFRTEYRIAREIFGDCVMHLNNVFKDFVMNDGNIYSLQQFKTDLKEMEGVTFDSFLDELMDNVHMEIFEYAKEIYQKKQGAANNGKH